MELGKDEMISQHCPMTAIRLTNDIAMQMIDAVRQEPLHKLVFPVIIRDEQNYVYELSDIVKWQFIGGVSPTTRKPFLLRDIEPVMYKGFKEGYKATIEALKSLTSEWKPLNDDDETIDGDGAAGTSEFLYDSSEQPTNEERQKQRDLLEKLKNEAASSHPAGQNSEGSESGSEENESEIFTPYDVSLLSHLYNAHIRYMQQNHNSPQIYGSPLLTQTRNSIQSIRQRLQHRSRTAAQSLNRFDRVHYSTFTPPSGFRVSIRQRLPHRSRAAALSLNRFDRVHYSPLTPPSDFRVSPNSVAGTILHLKNGELPAMKELRKGLFIGLVMGGTLWLLAQGLVASQLPPNKIIMTRSTQKAPNAMGTAKSSSMFF